MLCTFTIKAGNLVVRSDDIRQIEDLSPIEHANSGLEGAWSLLRWVIGDEIYKIVVKGTAAENRDRLSQDELDLMARIETHRYQVQMLLQAQPTPRGRQAK